MWTEHVAGSRKWMYKQGHHCLALNMWDPPLSSEGLQHYVASITVKQTPIWHQCWTLYKVYMKLNALANGSSGTLFPYCNGSFLLWAYTCLFEDYRSRALNCLLSCQDKRSWILLVIREFWYFVGKKYTRSSHI